MEKMIEQGFEISMMVGFAYAGLWAFGLQPKIKLWLGRIMASRQQRRTAPLAHRVHAKTVQVQAGRRSK